MMKEKIEVVFNALKELDLKATPHNVSIMNGVFDVLQEIYQELGDKEDERALPDDDGRNDN